MTNEREYLRWHDPRRRRPGDGETRDIQVQEYQHGFAGVRLVGEIEVDLVRLRVVDRIALSLEDRADKHADTHTDAIKDHRLAPAPDVEPVHVRVCHDV